MVTKARLEDRPNGDSKIRDAVAQLTEYLSGLATNGKERARQIFDDERFQGAKDSYTLLMDRVARVTNTRPENIFKGERDIRDFILILAKHLSFEDQPLEKAIIQALQEREVITIDSGRSIEVLIIKIHQALSDIMPNLRRSAVGEVVSGIVNQFRKVAQLDEELGPDVIERFLKTK